jgi:predicted dehydrogenase
MHLRIGLVGYGSWTRNAYVPAIQRSGRATIVSVAARSEMTRQRIREELGSDVQIFDSFASLFNGPRVDAVLIAVPDDMHEAVLTEALSAGVPVLYEPPLSHVRQHISLMVGRLSVGSQITHADLELGYIPAVKRVAEIVRAGTVGQIQAAKMQLQASWQAEPGNDLSTIGRLTPWYVDVLNRILGATPQRVFVMDGNGNAGRAQNCSLALFDYGKVWGTFSVNIASVGELAIGIEGHGTDGEFAADILTGEVRFRSRRKTAWTIENWPAQSPYASWPGVHESIAAFLEAVASGEPSSNGALKMAQLSSVALAAEEAKDIGTWALVNGVPSSTQNTVPILEQTPR